MAFVVVVLNVPFGYWRRTVRRFSLNWYLSIHIPVLMVIALRFSSGLGWQLVTFPVLIGAFSAGQLLGGKLFAARRRLAATPASLLPGHEELRTRQNN